jgi:hypothetical protein
MQLSNKLVQISWTCHKSVAALRLHHRHILLFNCDTGFAFLQKFQYFFFQVLNVYRDITNIKNVFLILPFWHTLKVSVILLGSGHGRMRQWSRRQKMEMLPEKMKMNGPEKHYQL